MPDPRLITNLTALRHNADTLIGGLKAQGVDTWAVTKVICGEPRAARIFKDAGASALAESRLSNIRRMRDAGVAGPYVLLRIAAPQDADDVVDLADISLQSELSTIAALDAASNRRGVRHKVVLMADLGDLREGEPAERFPELLQGMTGFNHLEVLGIGTNLTCYGGVIPDEANLNRLVDLHRLAERTLGRELPVVSGGNSSSLHLGSKGNLPAGVTNLRLGESLVLGRETAFGDSVPGTRQDVFTIRATVVELKRKASVPTGTIGMDAFGRTPTFEDRGSRLRAILAIGEQDIQASGLTPLAKGAEVLGASSDHLIVDVEDCEIPGLSVGSVMDFRPDYGALLRASTSAYIIKEFVD